MSNSNFRILLDIKTTFSIGWERVDVTLTLRKLKKTSQIMPCPSGRFEISPEPAELNLE